MPHIGQIVSGVGDISLTCTLNGQAISMSQKGTPQCIASSCNVTKWEAEKDQVAYGSEMLLGLSFEALYGADCSNNSAGKVTTGMLALAATSVAAAILF